MSAASTCQWCRLDSRRGHHSAGWCACLYQPSNDLDPDSIYMAGACARCGQFRARHDTGKCEWCSGPRRFPMKRRKSRRALANATAKGNS
jgi:hypothetical protein